MTERAGPASIDRRAVLALLAAAAVSPAMAQSAPSSIGLVEEVEGSAFARLRDIRKLVLSSDILLNDEVWTEALSRATLSLIGGNHLHLGASTRLKIDRYLAEAKGDIRLQSGALVFDRPDDLPKADISIRTVFGLIGVRGTRFFAGPSRGVFGLFVERGVVKFTAAGVLRVLEAGEGIDVPRPGAAPSEVRKWGKSRIDEAFASVLG